MAHVAHKQPVSTGLGRRAGRRVWIAAALAVAGVLLGLVLAGGGEETRPLDESGGAPATLNRTDGIRYDGGPDEGTRGVVPAKTVATTPRLRYDGGPEEGTADATAPAATNDSHLHGPGLRTD
jgi:hypothetical protein